MRCLLSSLIFKLLPVGLCLAFAACSKNTANQTLESPHWHLNGVPAPSSATVDKITDSIIPLLGGLTAPYHPCESGGKWRIDTVGLWNGRTVIDIFYETQRANRENPSEKYTHKAIKAIAVNTAGKNYRLVFLSWADAADIYFKPSQLLQVAELEILHTRSPMSGSGGYIQEYYWGWDENEDIPRLIGVGKVQGSAKKTDRPNQQARRSGDSLYITRAPFIFEGEDSSAPLEKLDWLYFNSYEKRYIPAPAGMSVDTLINQYVRIAISGRIYGDWRTTPFEWQVDTIGLLRGRPVVEIAYSFTCITCRDTDGKVIALETEPSKYRLIYLELSVPGESTIGKNAILGFDGDTLLAVKGNSTFRKSYTDNYWVLDNGSDVPVSLYQEWVLNETIGLFAAEKLPEELSVRLHKGKWDFYSLTYETYTWRTIDPDNKPSGGKLKIRFGIRHQRLVPVDIVFDPKDTISEAN